VRQHPKVDVGVRIRKLKAAALDQRSASEMALAEAQELVNG